MWFSQGLIRLQLRLHYLKVRLRLEGAASKAGHSQGWQGGAGSWLGLLHTPPWDCVDILTAEWVTFPRSSDPIAAMPLMA